MGGLLVDGREVMVAGLEIVNHRDHAWAQLDSRDYRPRRASYVSKLGVHTTQGIHPQRILPGEGPAGRTKRVARYWADSPIQSSAPLVVDGHGVACLGDLWRDCAYHATTANDGSIGIEMVQELGGGIHEATLENTVRLIMAICELSFHPELGKRIAIPFQIVADAYRPGQIVERLKHGGDDVAGIFGHRDQAWVFPWQMTPAQRDRWPEGHAGRGRGDPGDEIGVRLVAAGAEPLAIAAGEDLEVWRRRQTKLVALGQPLEIDGLPGPATMAALRRLGFRSGRELDAALELPLP